MAILPSAIPEEGVHRLSSRLPWDIWWYARFSLESKDWKIMVVTHVQRCPR